MLPFKFFLKSSFILGFDLSILTWLDINIKNTFFLDDLNAEDLIKSIISVSKQNGNHVIFLWTLTNFVI